MAAQKKVHLRSLGCDKNLVDSEKILYGLYEAGYVYTDLPEEADVIVVNTCCFIGDARDESIQVLLEMAPYRSRGRAKALIVTGCLAQRYAEEIPASIPEVDAVLGTNAFWTLPEVLEKLSDGYDGNDGKTIRMVPIDENTFDKAGTGRVVSTGGHYAYLKIAEGCDKHCTYCIIPSLRGRYRSVPVETLLQEADELAAKGVKELILVAQETTVYGMDLYGRKALPELLEKLCAIEGFHWIRLLYTYPEEITDELLKVMKTQKKLVHYLDMPVQHASDHMLKRMGRRTRGEELKEKIRHIREELPDIVLRTTLISGFPGETQADHDRLCDFVSCMGFERLGDFTYSREEGTPAAAFSHQISKKTKEKRRDEIMTLQQKIAFERAESLVGRSFEVMIEGRFFDEETEKTVYVGRTYMDAPDVDGLVYIENAVRDYMTGDFEKVRITASRGYDLTGVPADEN